MRDVFLNNDKINRIKHDNNLEFFGEELTVQEFLWLVDDFEAISSLIGKLSYEAIEKIKNEYGFKFLNSKSNSVAIGLVKQEKRGGYACGEGSAKKDGRGRLYYDLTYETERLVQSYGEKYGYQNNHAN